MMAEKPSTWHCQTNSLRNFIAKAFSRDLFKAGFGCLWRALDYADAVFQEEVGEGDTHHQPDRQFADVAKLKVALRLAACARDKPEE